MKAVNRCLAAVALAVLFSGALFTLQLVTHSAAVGALSQPLPAVAAFSGVEDARNRQESAGQPDESADDAGGFTDLYGNEVTDAIATYTFDKSGSLYELHSPQTELPRLGIPKS